MKRTVLIHLIKKQRLPLLLEMRERRAVLSALSTTPIDLDTLSTNSGVSLSNLYLLLVELELAGKLIRHSGGYVSLSNFDLLQEPPHY